MIKVCFISPTFPFMSCGVGDYVLELIKSLRIHKELDISVLTSKHIKIENLVKSKTIKDVKIYPVVRKWNFINLINISKIISRNKPDIIHIQYHWWTTNYGLPFKGLMAVLLPLFFKIFWPKTSIMTTIHSRLGGPYLFPKAGFLRKQALLPLFLFSDKIIVTNKYDGTMLSKWIPAFFKKIEFIRGGTGHFLKDIIDKDEIHKAKLQILSNSTDGIILSNFGFMIPHKGIEELLEAMRILIGKGYKLKLLAIGGFDIEVNFAGSYFEKIQKMAKNMGLTPHIQWTGFCEARQASLLLLTSDICIMPFPEGVSEWRSSFLDALSHGLPIVTTYSVKTPDDLINKVNCILVSSKNSNLLSDAVEELIVSPNLRRSLGVAAQELYQKEYDWPVIARKTVKVYMGQVKRYG